MESSAAGDPAVDPAELAADGGTTVLEDVRGPAGSGCSDAPCAPGPKCTCRRGGLPSPPGSDRMRPGPGAGSTGLAAHPDPEAATQHAAWEVLERDLVRRSWYGLLPGPQVVASAQPPEPLAELLDGTGATATALDLPAPPEHAASP
ncbi:YcaO-like family protein [Streptomyces sp. M10(2022)]